MVESARSPEGEALFRVERLDVAPRPADQRRSWADWLRQQGVRLFLWWNDVAFNKPAHAYLFGVPQGEVLDRNTIFNECWGEDYLPNSRTLDQHISQLRKRIEVSPKEPKLIRTVHGAGYRFEG